MKIKRDFSYVCSRLLTPFAFGLTGTISLGATAAHAVTFNFSGADTIDPLYRDEVVQGFTEAGNIWSSLITDEVTLNINIGFEALEPDVIAEANSSERLFSYTDIRNALIADATSSNDATTITNLPGGSSFDLLINGTSDNPNGSLSAVPYLDNNGSANNSNVLLTSANAKALGLIPANNSDIDASLSFNSLFDFYFGSSDSVPNDSTDFQSVVAHEIGHALGFISGVDILDVQPGFPEDSYVATTLDLFRYSTDSLAVGRGVIDLTAGCSGVVECDQYFSIDGGATKIASFSTGQLNGDGQQASHWQDDQLTGNYIGIMDPTYPVKQELSNTDKQAFDIIGWNIAESTSVPEPSSILGMMAVGLGFLLKRNKG